MNNIKKSQIIGQRLKRIRMDLGKSQEEFGADLHCAQRTLSKYEQEGINNLDEIIRIEKLLGVDLLSDDVDFTLCKKILYKIFLFYAHMNHSDKTEHNSFLTFQYLKDDILCGFSDIKLRLILSILDNKGLIKVYDNTNDLTDPTQFILMTSSGILYCDKADIAFPSHVSADLITTEQILQEFSKSRKDDIFHPAGNLNEMPNSLETDMSAYKDFIHPGNNLFLSSNITIGKSHLHRDNCNVLTIGGIEFYDMQKKNILESDSSLVIFDIGDRLLRETRYRLIHDKGYTVKVLNLADISHSDYYNPLEYVKNHADSIAIVDLLFKSADSLHKNPPVEKHIDQASRTLICALISYLKDNLDIPKDFKNFTNVMKLLQAALGNERSPDCQSPLDKLFAKVSVGDPNALSVKLYMQYKAEAGNDFLKVISNCFSVLNIFGWPDIETLSYRDTLELDKIGTQKTALFICCIENPHYNFLPSALYIQLVSVLESYETIINPKQYYIKKENEILATIKRNIYDDKLTERDAKRMQKYVSQARIKESILGPEQPYFIETKDFKKTFSSFESAKNFQEDIKSGVIEKGNEQTLYNVQFVINSFPCLIFNELLVNLRTIRKFKHNYLMFFKSFHDLKLIYEAKLDTFLSYCSIVMTSTADSQDVSYFNDIFDAKFLSGSIQALIFIAGIGCFSDKIIQCDSEKSAVYHHKPSPLIHDNTDFYLKGLEEFVGQAKPLDQVLKEAKIKTVHDAINRIVLKKDTFNTNES